MLVYCTDDAGQQEIRSLSTSGLLPLDLLAGLGWVSIAGRL
jgi:hypothetical protein